MAGCLAGLLLLAPSGAGAQARPLARPLACRVDPTVELLSVLVLLGRRDPPVGSLDFDHAYAHDARARFADLADHPAVQLAHTISARGFDDFVAQIASRVGPPPALVERRALFDIGDGPTPVRADTVRALVRQARDFARRAAFAEFYADHQPLYERLCARVLADPALADVPTRAATFFGVTAARYELVLMPLVPRLGVAPPGVRATAAGTLSAYVGPAGARDGDATFRTGWSLARVVLHEFAHQYVNAHVAASIGQLRRSSALLAPVRSRLWRADHIASWPNAVTETVVRASVAVMRGDAAGDEAERAELREQRALGFALVDSIAATLRSARSAARGARWWPGGMRAVIATLDRVVASPEARLASDPPFDGGMALAVIASAPDSILFIVPTEERDPALQDSLHAHVTRSRDRTAPRARIVTDREALTGDYRGWTLWAVGTLEGNAWLRAHAAALPALVDSARVVADTVYEGHSLVFVGAVPSPLDARRPLLLTVGQRLDALMRGWWLFTADYAVVDGGNVLTRGTFATEGGRRRFVPAAEGGTASGRGP